jgi:quercetin dioxygenase-like cupin family protein
MALHDLRAALGGAGERELTTLGRLNGAAIGVVRFSGATHWERHPAGEELLHILDGAVDIDVLDGGSVRRTRVPAGAIFIVAAGRWHHVIGAPAAALFFVTPGAGTEHRPPDAPPLP